MKLRAEIAGQVHLVEVRQDGAHVFAKIDDREYQMEARQAARGLWLTHNARVFECSVEGALQSGETLSVTVGNRAHLVALTDPKRLRGAAQAGAHTDQAAQIIAPMPGKVVRILVEVGAVVEAGAGILVVEAMKMQNELKSPKTGSVIALNVRPGDTVNGGDVLAVVE